MKWIVILALLGGAGYLGYRYFHNPGHSTASSESGGEDSFLSRCRKASKNVPRVDEYCACLEARGIDNMLMLGANPAGREAMAACQEKVGHSGPTPGLNPE